MPTYNEAENLPIAISAICGILPDARILIIDDNSPDGTGDIADLMAKKNDRISVLHRPCKQGLGQAYRDGFQVALTQPGIRLIAQMDADLSHSPRRLPDMIQAAEQADLVIGSRYVPGGGTQNWNLLRRAISRFGSFYARKCLGLSIFDLTAGFKLWRKDMLAQVMNYPISATGYVFQIEATYIASRLGARITELPILFVDRNIGQSKMTASIALEAFWRLPIMRYQKKDYPL